MTSDMTSSPRNVVAVLG